MSLMVVQGLDRPDLLRDTTVQRKGSRGLVTAEG